MIVGCCGTAGRTLEMYSKYLDAVEIQSTFYKMPKRETVLSWRNRVPKGFIFTMKAFQGITHPSDSPTWRRYRKLIENIDESEVGMLVDSEFVHKAWEETISIARELKAEAIVVQLPPSFSYTHENLQKVMKLPYRIFKLAVEFRHKSWFGNISKISERLNKMGGVVVWDPLKFGNIRQRTYYYRLHGKNGFTNYKYCYSEEEIRKLYDYCREKNGFVFFNNVKMWENALMLKSLMSQS
jgi:uncharacterized protein YecE (DUF72 family)